jgi:aminopeptidase N
VQHYTIDLGIAPLSTEKLVLPQVTSLVTITARATQDLSAFSLDFAGEALAIDALDVDGLDAVYTQDDRKLTITPTASLAADAIFTTTIRYAGIPGEDYPQSRGVTRVGWNRFETGLYTFHVPDGASTWLPCNDHPRDKASFTFVVAAPNPFVVAANGTLEETTDLGNATRVRWEMSDPMATYLAALVVAEQAEQTLDAAGQIGVRVYAPTTVEDEQQETMQSAFAPLPEMLAFFETRFGPYPFEQAGAVTVDTLIEAFEGMEHQTMALYPNNAGSYRENVIAHELAHEWYGNSVSLTSWQETWLKEGFATYAEWLWLEHREGPEALKEQLRSVYESPAQPWGSYPPVRTPQAHELLNDSVYFRGALTLHALRVRVGDDQFFAILQAFAERYRHANASTDEFIALAEELSGEQLDGFFDAWLAQRAIPPIDELGLE